MIKDQQGFQHYKNWYKGNLHSHTTTSDGKLTPAEAVELFRSHGYSFLCFSEHDRYTDRREEFDREDFIILPGLEASAILLEEGSRKRKKVHHIHGILGTREMEQEARDPVFHHLEWLEPAVYEGEWDGARVAQKLCDDLRKRGCITIYNHPIWSRVDAEEFIHTKGLWALEIFNYNTVNESNTGFDSTYWDLMLRKGKKIWAVAADDNHNEGLFDDACGGFIMVNAPKLEREEILQNMLAGNYYLSAGPNILDWKIEHGIASVACSPVHRIDFIAGNHVNDGISYVEKEYENTLTKGEYRLHGDETYIRVQCTDVYGRTAWSNPFFLK